MNMIRTPTGRIFSRSEFCNKNQILVSHWHCGVRIKLKVQASLNKLRSESCISDNVSGRLCLCQCLTLVLQIGKVEYNRGRGLGGMAIGPFGTLVLQDSVRLYNEAHVFLFDAPRQAVSNAMRTLNGVPLSRLTD